MHHRQGHDAPTAERLRASDLTFHVFDRSLHPELFSVRQGLVLERADLHARIYLTAAGHYCSYSRGKTTLSETLCPTVQPLPRRRKWAERPAADGAEVIRKLGGGAEYRFSVMVRRCKPAEFVELQETALQASAAQPVGASLIDAGERPDRWHGLRALSWIRYELSADALRVRAFHALPVDFAVVETSSCFTLPRA